VQKNRL